MKTYAVFYMRADFVVDVEIEDGQSKPEPWMAADKLEEAIRANPNVLRGALYEHRTPAVLVTNVGVSERLDTISASEADL